MKKDVFVYLSGPITAKHGATIEENVAAGVRVFLDWGIIYLTPSYCDVITADERQ